MLYPLVVLTAGAILILIAVTQALQATQKINLLLAVNAIFVVIIAPKIVLYHLYGNDVFLTGTVNFGQTDVNAAVIAILAFVASVNAVYLSERLALPPVEVLTPQSHRPAGTARVIHPATAPVFFLMFAGFLTAFLINADRGGGSLLSKPVLISEGARTMAYYMQKLTQTIKCLFYLYLVALVTAGGLNRRDSAVLALATVLTAAVFMLSGQRSGIILMALQLMMALQIAGLLKLRYIAYALPVMIAINIAVLSGRVTTEFTGFGYIDAFARRYFFELEKITAIIGVAASQNPFPANPLLVLADRAAPPLFTGSLHAFIGSEALGSRSAVPPSFPGQVLFWFGGIALIPASLAFAAAVRFAERRTQRARSGLVQVAAIAALSSVYYLALNTDLTAAVKRAGFELTLLGLALLVNATMHHILKRKMGTT